MRSEGVHPIQIFLARVGYALVFVLVGVRAWGSIFSHRGDWDPYVAAAVSMWASSSLLSLLGLVNPLRWLPLFLFEIGYKLIWLVIVAWPLWRQGRLAGSSAEGLTYAFLPVVVPILLVPWGYVFRTYVAGRSRPPGGSVPLASHVEFSDDAH